HRSILCCVLWSSECPPPTARLVPRNGANPHARIAPPPSRHPGAGFHTSPERPGLALSVGVVMRRSHSATRQALPHCVLEVRSAALQHEIGFVPPWRASRRRRGCAY